MKKIIAALVVLGLVFSAQTALAAQRSVTLYPDQPNFGARKAVHLKDVLMRLGGVNPAELANAHLDRVHVMALAHHTSQLKSSMAKITVGVGNRSWHSQLVDFSPRQFTTRVLINGSPQPVHPNDAWLLHLTGAPLEISQITLVFSSGGPAPPGNPPPVGTQPPIGGGPPSLPQAPGAGQPGGPGHGATAGYSGKSLPLIRFYGFGQDNWVTTGIQHKMLAKRYQQRGVVGEILPHGRFKGAVPLFDCVVRGGKDHFLATDPGCEGQKKIRRLGFVYNPGIRLRTPGVTLLYRCLDQRGRHMDHFASTDPGCEGYFTEKPLGHILLPRR